jgi:hypothetical protein
MNPNFTQSTIAIPSSQGTESVLHQHQSSHAMQAMPPMRGRRMKRNRTPVLVNFLRSDWWSLLYTKIVAAMPGNGLPREEV